MRDNKTWCIAKILEVRKAITQDENYVTFVQSN